ncbi:MAG TPA: FecR family protein [Bacteroidales bacterium]|nr:FecR family protein [Bacteroidales bacterium]
MGIAFVLGLFAFCYLNFKEYQYTTINNKRTISLRDGSEIVLNVKSSIIHNAGYGLINRNVELTGEAFISTRKKRYLPFIIKTATAKVKVTGTLFNIRATENTTEVGVLEGKVDFSSIQKKGRVVAIPNGFYSFCKAGKLPEKPTELTYSGYPDWMNNRFEYQDADLKRILSEIETHFCIRIEVKDPQILNQKYSGIIEGASPEVVLQTLVVQIDHNMSFNGNTFLIY